MIYSKGDFLKLLGKFTKDGRPNHAWLKVNIDRGRLNENQDGAIDTDDPLTQVFFRKWVSLRGTTVENRPKKEKPKKEPKIKEIKEKRPEKIQKPEKKVKVLPPITDPEDLPSPQKSSDDLFDLELRRKRVELEKAETSHRLMIIKEQKLKGEIIPVDLVEILFQTHGQSVITAQKEAIEDILIKISAQHRLKAEQLAKLRGEMIDILNMNVDRARDITMAAMQAMLSEYSMKREAGERDHD